MNKNFGKNTIKIGRDLSDVTEVVGARLFNNKQTNNKHFYSGMKLFKTSRPL